MSEIADWIEAWSGPEAAACAVPIGAGGALAPAEIPAMARAIPSRRAEFAAGRDAARRAMRRLGLPAMAVPMRPDRAPLWPEGLCGSISHDADLAVAVVRRGAGALGLDIEPATPLDPALWSEIASTDEIGQPVPGVGPGQIARLVFAAKEAAYKAQYPASGRVLGFEAMRIEIVGDGLVARLRMAVGPYADGTAFRGAWAIMDGRFVVMVEAPSISDEADLGFKLRNTELIHPTGMVSRTVMR